MDLHEVYRNSGLGKWFHGESANKTPGWDRYNSEGELVGECGDAKKGESYSACLSKQKADKLGKEGIASFVRRKRAAQSEAGRGEKGAGGKGQKPINVDTGASKMDECVQCNEEVELINEGKNKPNDPGKWSACKSAAKKKFDVYPSAYANAWAARCYKKKGGTWRSIKESTNDDYERQDAADNEARMNLVNIADPTERKIGTDQYISKKEHRGLSAEKAYGAALANVARVKHRELQKKPNSSDSAFQPPVSLPSMSGSPAGGIPLILPNVKGNDGKPLGALDALKENLKIYTKNNIIASLFENNKMKDGPGKTSQRPKSFGKGGKSGTEQTQARREGKRQAQEHD